MDFGHGTNVFATDKVEKLVVDLDSGVSECSILKFSTDSIFLAQLIELKTSKTINMFYKLSIC